MFASNLKTSAIYKELPKSNGKKATRNKTWARYLRRRFIKDEAQIVSVRLQSTWHDLVM
jgi:hypothetical protein